MRLTPYGRREWGWTGLAAAALALSSILLALPGLAIAAGLFWLAIAAFFRDPDRALPDEPGAFTAPADGLVDDVTLLTGGDECERMGCARVHRIGTFLSVFDVHINRAPCALTVTGEIHRPGGYRDARDPLATRLNEAHTLVGTAAAENGGGPVIVRQIAGLVARRIVCGVGPGSTLARGQRYGMIKFGSRTELYLPAVPEIEIAVRPGTRVKGGISILARYRSIPSMSSTPSLPPC
jgi:phosphatidylserine decarboxylase